MIATQCSLDFLRVSRYHSETQRLQARKAGPRSITVTLTLGVSLSPLLSAQICHPQAVGLRKTTPTEGRHFAGPGTTSLRISPAVAVSAPLSQGKGRLIGSYQPPPSYRIHRSRMNTVLGDPIKRHTSGTSVNFGSPQQPGMYGYGIVHAIWLPCWVSAVWALPIQCKLGMSLRGSASQDTRNGSGGVGLSSVNATAL